MRTTIISARSHRWVRLALGCTLLALLQSGSAIRAQAPATVQGQTVTRLPDGRELLVGGVAASGVQSGAWLRDVSGSMTQVAGLASERAWHTATVLPDGSVLILGGVDARGRAIATAERFDPELVTFATMPALKWKARSALSATLVDGEHLVLAGGIVNGAPVGDVDVLDLAAWQVTSIGTLTAERAYHSAALLADGRVELWGGQGTSPQAATSGAIIDFTGPSISEVFAPEQDDPSIWIATSDPADGAAVPVPQRITLRFSRAARAETLTSETITISSSAGDIAAMVVPAERGRLAFVTPTAALQPNSSYLVTVNGAHDTRGAAFPVLSLTFSTTDATALSSQPPDEGVWDPRAEDASHTWRSKRAESAAQKLEPLRAPGGVTAVSGQVLRLDGSPLAAVQLELEDRSTTTDSTGRFLLVNDTIATGWHELWIDGRKAKGKGATFGTFEAAIWVTKGTTAVLPFTIWMPVIDTAHAVKIQSPTSSETVVTTPLIPGLEVRLPAGTVITDEEGKIVREVSITPIPVDRPPFPLPAGVDVPIYFTIQPGGAYLRVSGSGGTYQNGARIIYPNYRNRPAGAPMAFWHYEPEDGRGWYVYGAGAISADGRQAVPSPGVSIREFTGAMVAPPSYAPPSGPSSDDEGKGGDPVHLGTGLFVLTKTDLSLPDLLPIAITRTYRQNDTLSRAFGIGATHRFEMFLVGDTYPYTYTDLILPDGGRVHYVRTSSGTGYSNAVYEHTSSPGRYFKSHISWNGTGWNLDLRDGSRMTFPDGFNATRPSQAAVTGIQDRYGNVIALARDSSGDLTKITSPNGRFIELTYDTSHRITQAKDHIGRIVGYTYDAYGRLWKVTDAANGVTEYTYDTSHRILTLKDPRNIVFLTNAYDSNGRVSQQTQADNTTFQFAYTLDAQGRVTQVDVTDPRSIVRRVAYNAASGYLTSDTAAYGTSVARTITFTRNGNNHVTRVNDGLNRNTDYGHDALGNITSVTRLAGTGSAVTTSYTYDSTFSVLTSITDPLNHTTAFTRDSLGNVTTVTDALNHQTTFTYTTSSQPLTVTTAAGVTQFAYDGADLVAITDPLGRTTMRFVDAVGRVLRTTNPLGQSTWHEYDGLNAITKTIDALGSQTTLTYDANRNLLTLTDALNHTTTYTYDNMDRVATRTDPLNRADSYVYDDNGNLQQVTDRKNQVTSYAYDSLNRLSTVTYADSSTTTHTYDAGDRLTQIVDSIAGTISRTWDLLDRMTQETTPEGTVNYTYDAADRRATMTVAGQPQVTYGYDNADRLTSITQNSATVGFIYDSAGRRTVLTLANGMTVEYVYDAASQVTSLTYKLGTTTLGDLSYTYDPAGNRSVVGGSWSRTGLPTSLTSATYDAANQIATWAGTSFSYDANGNLTSDGSKTYTWNSRNQLTALSGGVSASFQYDGLGRRRAKTVSGSSTGFLYDRLNAVQELAGGSPSANILSALGIDEWLTRSDGAGGRHFLLDGLGSTVALADSSGTVVTEYTSQPFGETTVAGSPSANASQFTGRENDGTGLFYYRARYFEPTLHRFIREDPIEFEGGDVNLYAYVGNSPSNGIDPLGLEIVILGRGDFAVRPSLPRNVAGRATRPVRPGPAPKIRPGNWKEPDWRRLLEPSNPTDSPGLWERIGDVLEEILKRFGSQDDIPGIPPADPECDVSGRKCEPPPCSDLPPGAPCVAEA